jgi:hypothetical protein
MMQLRWKLHLCTIQEHHLNNRPVKDCGGLVDDALKGGSKVRQGRRRHRQVVWSMHIPPSLLRQQRLNSMCVYKTPLPPSIMLLENTYDVMPEQRKRSSNDGDTITLITLVVSSRAIQTGTSTKIKTVPTTQSIIGRTLRSTYWWYWQQVSVLLCFRRMSCLQADQ